MPHTVRFPRLFPCRRDCMFRWAPRHTAGMTSNLKRPMDTPRTIARILCRAFMCAAGLAMGTTAANAQANLPQMAYRFDWYQLIDCAAGCALDVWPIVVTPWATFWGFSHPTWSPDAARIAVTDGYNIYVIPSTGGNAIPLTSATEATEPAWSPDGGQIAFVRWTSGPWELGVMNPDGSGVRTLSNRVGGNNDPSRNVAHPAWSPDSARIAFTCEIDLNNLDLCVINRDGTGLVRLTNHPAADWSPVWSPDGTRIAFSTDRFGGGNVLALMNSDGSGVSQLGASIRGWPGSWSPDGAQIAFTTGGDPVELCGGTPGGTTCATYFPLLINTVTPDGAVVTPLVYSGGDPAWCPLDPCVPTTVPITVETNPPGLQITIDGTTSVAPRISYWAPGSSHTIATHSPQGAAGIRNVFASWSDAGAMSHGVAPTAATTFTANFTSQYLLTTGVSPGASGSITASPASGDGFYDFGASVQLTATPSAGFTFVGFNGNLAGVTNPQALVMNAPKTVIANFSVPMHIGDLDGARTNLQNAWTADVTITLHDSTHGPVAHATVNGSWDDGGTTSCDTDASGKCTVSRSGIPNRTASVSLTVNDVAKTSFLYQPAGNHDQDGDSNGSTIVIRRR
jgi:hypothetical protein